MCTNFAVASPKKYVGRGMPDEWSTLPMHPGPKRPGCGSVAVYTEKGPNKDLVYEGYISPNAKEKIPTSALQRRSRIGRLGKKLASLQEKIRADNEAQAQIMSEYQRVEGSAMSSGPKQCVVRAEPSAASECNGYSPFPMEILDCMERFLPVNPKGQAEEFPFSLEPLEDRNMDLDWLCSDSFVQSLNQAS